MTDNIRENYNELVRRRSYLTYALKKSMPAFRFDERRCLSHVNATIADYHRLFWTAFIMPDARPAWPAPSFLRCRATLTAEIRSTTQRRRLRGQLTDLLIDRVRYGHDV